MAEAVSRGDNQDGGGYFIGEVTKMAEDVHTERLLVTMFRFLHMLLTCKYSNSLYTPWK